jgi:dephospho-CoA kinase
VSAGAVARPPFIGLTGGIAAGKSEVLAALERLGAQTLSADAVVHELLGSELVRDQLVGRWGPDVAPGGVVDRARVGALVFDSPDELAWLESRLHPLVGETMVAWSRELPEGTELAVVEVPLLFEAEMESRFDATIAVVADDTVREQRAAGQGLGNLTGRADRQLTPEEKAARATHVIRNEGSLADLQDAVEALWPQLTAAGKTAA